MSNMILNNNILDILEEFATDFNKKIYGREIAKKLKMNQKTVSNILKRLEKEHILKFSVEGKNKYYYLNNHYANISPNERSDLDILIIGKNEEIKDLEELYNIKINIIRIDKNNFDKNDTLIKETIKNHVILKGVEDFIELIW